MVFNIFTLVVSIVYAFFFFIKTSQALPPILEASINPETFTIKLTAPSDEFLTLLEKSYALPLEEAFASVINDAKKLSVTSILGVSANTMAKAVLVSPSIDGKDNYFLAGPLAVTKSALDRLFSDERDAFIQIILPQPRSFPQPHSSQGEEDFNTTTTTSDTSNSFYSNGENISGSNDTSPSNTLYEPNSLTHEEAVENFLLKFLKVDLSEDNAYIPESVRKTLQGSQQVIVNPTAYLHLPETTSEISDNSFSITSASPVSIIFGLLERNQIEKN
jgi:hypothetical protein